MVSTKDGESKRLFGTNGIRGFPNVDLTTDFCSRIGRSIGEYAPGSVIAMGRDTRSTGDFVQSSVLSGVLASGKSVLDLGILPTPAVQYYCKTKGIFGIVITASHNPPEFNGIKCIADDGTELDRAEEERIEGIFHMNSFAKVPWDRIGTVTHMNEGLHHYVGGILDRIDPDSIRRRNYRVLVDTGNGASFRTTPFLLEQLNCSLVTLNANPDGRFSSRNSEPKPENLGDLMSLMKSGRFDLGVAHDGDADRAVFIDEKGRFIDGDKTLSLVVKSVVKKGDKVVTPISSSDAIDEVCAERGARVIRTKVGAPIVSRAMILEEAAIGGEENGGVIYGAHQYCRDGAMTLGLVLSLMATTGKPISGLISELPDYTMSKNQVPLRMDREKLIKAVSEDSAVTKADFTDGIKIIRDDGWVLVRPSGTEPIVRVYGQSRSADTARKYCDEFVSLVEKIQSQT